MTMIDYHTIADLDPRGQVVDESRPVGGEDTVDVIDDFRWRIVVVGHSHLEGDSEHGPGDGLARNPGKRSDRTLDTHAITSRWD